MSYEQNIKFISEQKNLFISVSKQLHNQEISLRSEYESEMLKFQQARDVFEKEIQSRLNDEKYILDVVNNVLSEYNYVKRTLLIYAVVFLLCTLFFFVTDFLITLGFISCALSIFFFWLLKLMIDHIDNVARIRNSSSCQAAEPYFYKWFGRPTLVEIFNRMSQKRNATLNAELDKYRHHFNETERKRKKDVEDRVIAIRESIKNQIIELTENCNNEVARIDTIHFPIPELTSNFSGVFKDKSGRITFTKKVEFKPWIYCNTDTYSNSLGQKLKLPNFFQFENKKAIFIFDADKNAQNHVNEIVFKNLLGIKPGKMHLHFYDPLEFGAFFSAFHDLPKEIRGGVAINRDGLDELLSMLIRHIATVREDILRSNFNSLNEFNIANPEMAEPFKFVFINDYPEGFDDSTKDKLVKIINSGFDCGIILFLISKIPVHDIKLQGLIKELPVSYFQSVFSRNIDFKSFSEQYSAALINAGKIVISVDHLIGETLNWWKFNSSEALELPIGKRGKELQTLKFNNDDDNQALMVGKPGSGKSNLLHVIITTAITRYSPEELEIYLIDFKGGVEFSVYADVDVPHLRTVALESDREFGLSVIDGVEKELLRRENLFRENGVQNISQFNSKYTDRKLPRILFIVDEFQEFFVEDDDLCLQVENKYDRIIRKGRAFGINSLFSSQTLEGKSIPRTTKDLIDIRIALMCGDNDVYEIMDSKNPAAKDLSRPGEAIYNAENGKEKGNERFQAAFIEREKIKEIVQKVSEIPRSELLESRPKFIFRGSQKASITKINHPIYSMDVAKSGSIRFWLGESITMSPDVFGDFKRVSNSNFFVLGAADSGNNIVDPVSRIFSSLIFCLNNQNDKLERIYVINPIQDSDDFYQNYQVAYGESDLIEFVSQKNLETFFEMLNDEMDRRKESDLKLGAIFVFINTLQKMKYFRENSHFEDLFSEAPEYGIYFIVGCDSYSNLKRTSLNLDHFNFRLAFNMNLDYLERFLNISRANNIKNNRAYFYSDDSGVCELIKPYELVDNFNK